MDIVSSYPLWYYLLGILLSALISFFLYRRDKKLQEFPRYLVALLISLRFLSIALLAVLLLSPLLKYLNKVIETPIVIIAQDNSSSLLNGQDSTAVKTAVEKQLQDLNEELARDYKVEYFLFDESVRRKEAPANFTGKLSDFENLFNELDNRFVNQNVGAMILVSDGLYNRGTNPVYLGKKLSYPVYTLALGDTVQYKDLGISQVRNNQLAFLGNQFPVEVDVHVREIKGEEYTLELRAASGLVYRKTAIAPSSNHIETFSFLLDAASVGMQRYTAKVLPQEEEKNVLNNSMDFYVDVLDGRQRIALLGLTPHPDIAALKRSIEKSENYEVSSTVLDKFEAKPEDFDLFILHQTHGKGNISADYPPLAQILASNKPLLLIGSGWGAVENRIGLSKLNRRQRFNSEDAQASYNESFPLFTLSDDLKKLLPQFPPLLVVNEGGINVPPISTLFYQKIGAVQTRYSMLSFYEVGQRKIGRWVGENSWKWAMSDFAETASHKHFDELVGKLVQYLAIKADRSFFRVHTENEFYENESILVNAQLYNQSYYLINEPEVSISFFDEENKEYPYVFNRVENGYQLSVPNLPAGHYRFVATTRLNGEAFEDNGRLTIKALQLEQLESVANHRLLYQLSKESGARLFYPDQMSDLLEDIKTRNDIVSISYQNEEVRDVINLKWIFFLILTLLSIEWFIRKRGGAY
jgi:hypothetical protein